jgi:hypothetical protein
MLYARKALTLASLPGTVGGRRELTSRRLPRLHLETAMAMGCGTSERVPGVADRPVDIVIAKLVAFGSHPPHWSYSREAPFHKWKR